MNTYRCQMGKIEPHCLAKLTDCGRSGENNQKFLETVLWIVRTGSPWWDLSPELYSSMSFNLFWHPPAKASLKVPIFYSLACW